MVVWKNNAENAEVGYKAKNLEQIEGFNVPNFYVITREETKKAVQDNSNPRKILNQDINQEQQQEWKKAFKELGMSNEVRNSNGKARNLVTGQRNNVKASVRISEQPKTTFKKELNVPKNQIEDTVKELLADYHQNKTEDAPRHPSIIVQKMIEPEYTVATTTNYKSDTHLVEVVPGLGTTLEKATTRPEIHLTTPENKIKSRTPNTQLKAEKHPVNGSLRQKKIERNQPALNESEIKKITGKLENQGLSAKFVYKRGTFYAVDAKQAKETNPFTENQKHTTGIRASPGEIKGRVGEQIQVKETAQNLQNKPLILHKGSYQSNIAQKARNKQIPLIVNYNQQLTEEKRIQLGQNQTKIQQNTNDNSRKHQTRNQKQKERHSNHKKRSGIQNNSEQQKRGQKKSSDEQKQKDSVSASEILALNAQGGITLSPPHHNSKYAVSSQETPAGENIPTENYLTSYQEIFQHGKTNKEDTKIIDSRKLEEQGLENALKYIEAENKILILEKIQKDILYTAINQGFAKFATTQHKQSQLEQKLQEAEKKYLIDGIREIKHNQ